ncbi:MAG: molybdate ABC transporter ATP-binding protein ModF [Succinatimonas hippei]|nr:molybdate ABC transporter ATP-binding protein ModF [Succinatimonas hippei]
MTSRTIAWENAEFKVNEDPSGKQLIARIGDLTIKPEDLIVLIGGNGSGKTSIARALSGDLKIISGTAPVNYHPVLVSFEKQMKLFEDDYNMRNSDATTAKEEIGLTPADLLKDADQTIRDEVIEGMNLKALMDKPLRQLSGGEGRKALLAQALCSKPNLLVLDTPFDALDVQTRKALLELIDKVHTLYKTPVVLIVNRPSEIPSSLTKMGIIQKLAITKISSREEIEQDPDAKALLGFADIPDVKVPKTPAKFAQKPFTSGPIVQLRNIHVEYQRVIFDHFNFTVNRGEHWHIMGPNGAGKSTLLSLITGDNPLVYANDVTVFGYKRGSGESIWDIKKCYGYVSGSLHLDYRVSAPAINVVLSGFYDSIGLYNHPGDDEIACARAWLATAGLSDREHMSFRQLSFGQQRMLLIIRALVKTPLLLILDEPLQGLDGFARAQVKAYISYIMKNGETSVLFVSHHDEDIPEGFTNRLSFIKSEKGDGYDIVQEKLLQKL